MTSWIASHDATHYTTESPTLMRLSTNGMNHTCLCLPSRSWSSFTNPRSSCLTWFLCLRVFILAGMICRNWWVAVTVDQLCLPVAHRLRSRTVYGESERVRRVHALWDEVETPHSAPATNVVSTRWRDEQWLDGLRDVRNTAVSVLYEIVDITHSIEIIFIFICYSPIR